MPAYAYQGMTSKGRAVKGVATAENVGVLKASLKRDGVFLTQVTETNAPGVAPSPGAAADRNVDLSGLFDRVTPKMVAATTRLLGTLLHAGVTLPESLKAMTDQVESQRLKGILSDVAVRVNEGSSLADSLSRYPKVFPQLYINMVRAGEASGALETVLFRLAEFLEKQIEIQGRVSKALMYPIVLAILGAGIVTVLMVSIVPKITGMFADMQAELPWNTKLLIWLSDFISGFWWLILIGIVGGIWLFRRWRASRAGKWVGDTILLGLPVVGELVRKIAIARFARTLSTLLASGVQLLAALDIVKSLLGNVVLERVVGEARDNIREGEGIANALKRSRQFPPLVTHMIAVGERSGQLEQMLTDLADAYDRETNQAIDKFTTLLEPLTIVIMGGAVGFVIYSIMRPIMMITEMAGKT
ncbi:MAG: type II secretion system inner membrane protein GspF [Deltaproteobacteria bacterium]|nr:type II secretion system inner membrane protein GspF [Deltaproteobacteria bacterium]MBK8236989.1 type II secretion system inner membrane protein GspF [Deltaproteobacteria bacterium]MBK8719200.1 type II secretion system inner membrane protein GspF [Deltaproteobacteria bacterium]MBP7290863.1 type II secretion system inner membrane protein GspF [Nannocystaceae bacterium]